MIKLTLSSVAILSLSLVPGAFAAEETKFDKRADHAVETLQALLKGRDGVVPRAVLAASKCVAVIPGVKRAAFASFGGHYGAGLATCRVSDLHWSKPTFVQIRGGSWGLQIGIESTDAVLFFMSDRAVAELSSSKFQIGGFATAAAGPWGREVDAATDLRFRAEILSYSRSRGLFAGVALQGGVMNVDRKANQKVYGKDAPEAGDLLKTEFAAEGTASQALKNFVSAVEKSLLLEPAPDEGKDRTEEDNQVEPENVTDPE